MIWEPSFREKWSSFVFPKFISPPLWLQNQKYMAMDGSPSFRVSPLKLLSLKGLIPPQRKDLPLTLGFFTWLQLPSQLKTFFLYPYDWFWKSIRSLLCYLLVHLCWCLFFTILFQHSNHSTFFSSRFPRNISALWVLLPSSRLGDFSSLLMQKECSPLESVVV